jgi:hypothetical protein
MNRIFLKAAPLKVAALSLILAAAPAYASSDEGEGCGSAPRDQWMSVDAAKAKGIAMGYEVRKVKVEDGCYELYAVDKNGARAELYMNPVSGEVVRSKDDD